MTEEHTTITSTPDGETHTRTTVYNDTPRSGGAGKWVFLLILLIIAVAAFVAYDRLGMAEVAKDNAVAEAAGDVGDAAQKVGDAAEDVADGVTPD